MTERASEPSGERTRAGVEGRSHLRRTRSIALVGLGLLWTAIVVVYATGPATGYEASIYGGFPWYFWVATIGAMFCGLVVVLRSARSDRRDRFWIVGLALAFATNAMLVLLPYIRGYVVYGRADVLSHVGMIHDLAGTTLDSPESMYYNTHIVVQALSYATGLEPIGLIGVLAPVVSIVYFGGLCFAVTHVFEARDRVLLGLAFASIPVAGSAHVVTVPFLISILLVPFVLYLFVKEQRTNAVPVRIALLVTVVAFVLYHPLTAAFMIAVFVVYVGTKWTEWFEPRWVGPTNVASFTFAVFAAWYFNFVGVIRRFEGVVDSLLGRDEGGTQLDAYTQTVDQASPELIDLVRIAVVRYGVDVLVSVLVGVFVAVAAYRWHRRRGSYTPNIFVLLSAAACVLFTASAFVFLVNDLIAGWGRPLAFRLAFAIVVIAALISLAGEYTTTRSRRRGLVLSVYVVVFALLVVATLGMFHSPIGSDMNEQTTQMELDGTEWTFEHRNEERLIDEFGIRQYRFAHAHYGTNGTAPTIRRDETVPPPRFNYTTHDTLGESYDEDTYLFLTERGRISYPAQFPNYEDQWRYTPEDFDRIERDPTVVRLYDNGDFDTYLIDGTRTGGV